MSTVHNLFGTECVNIATTESVNNGHSLGPVFWHSFTAVEIKIVFKK